MGNKAAKLKPAEQKAILDGVLRQWIEQAGQSLHNLIEKLVIEKLTSGEYETPDEAIAYGNGIAAAFTVACVGSPVYGGFFHGEDFGSGDRALYYAFKGKSDTDYRGDTGLLLRTAMKTAVEAKGKSGEFDEDFDGKALAFGTQITAAFAEAHKEAMPESSYESGCDFKSLFKAKLIKVLPLQ